MRRHLYWVYILTNLHRTVLYIGITNNLTRRLHEHRSGRNKGFTKKYNCNILVYFEQYSDVTNAIAREKELKKWKRHWKLALIKNENPELRDLSTDIA